MGDMGETETTSPSGEFDPASVPPYPVITLTGADDPDNVTVDQQRFEGEDAYEQALKACVARAQELGGAVRVRGVARDGSEWPMVVTTDGQLHELPAAETPETRAKKTSRRRLLMGVGIGAGALLLVGGGVGGAVAWNAAHQEPPPAPPPLYPGKGANLPVLPPAGASTTASWAVVIDDDADVQLLEGGQLAFLSSDNQLVIVDAETGQLQWAGGSPSRFGTLGILRGENSTALANVTSRGLDLWDLAATSVSAPIHLDVLEIGATPLMTGEGVLFDLGGQSAQLYGNGEMTLLDIPVPAVAAGAREGTAVAVNHTDWLQITPDNAATASPLEDLPGGGKIDQARVLGPDLLAARWRTEDATIMTVHTLPEGSSLGAVTLRAGTTSDEVLAAPGGEAWVWNGVLITADGLTALEDYVPEGTRFDAELVTDTEVWGRADQTPARLLLSSRELLLDDTDAVLPVATHNSLAYIVATKLEDTILHAVQLPPSSTSDASDNGGEDPAASDAGGTQ